MRVTFADTLREEPAHWWDTHRVTYKGVPVVRIYGHRPTSMRLKDHRILCIDGMCKVEVERIPPTPEQWEQYKNAARSLWGSAYILLNADDEIRTITADGNWQFGGFLPFERVVAKSVDDIDRMLGGAPMLTESALIQQRTRITKSGKPRTETFYYFPCPKCGRGRFLRKKDMHFERLCKHCASHLKGKLAFAATEPKLSKKYGGKKGAELWAEMAREGRERRPTVSESAFEALLAGMKYKTNVILPLEGRFWIADFVIEDCIVVEINGGVHKLHEERDRQKYGAYLRAGYTVIVMEADDVSLDWLWKGLV